MQYTPFDNQKDLEYFAEQDIEFIDDPSKADMLIARGARIFAKRLLQKRMLTVLWKKKIVFTHEPRRDTHFRKKIYGYRFLPCIHIMNAYTGEIYTDNYTRYGYRNKKTCGVC